MPIDKLMQRGAKSQGIGSADRAKERIWEHESEADCKRRSH